MGMAEENGNPGVNPGELRAHTRVQVDHRLGLAVAENTVRNTVATMPGRNSGTLKRGGGNKGGGRSADHITEALA